MFGKKSSSSRILGRRVIIFLTISSCLNLISNLDTTTLIFCRNIKLSLGFPGSLMGLGNTFTVLPFGLSSAPYIFSKVVRVLVKYWRSHAVRITVCLDDGLGSAQVFQRCSAASVLVNPLNFLFICTFLSSPCSRLIL